MLKFTYEQGFDWYWSLGKEHEAAFDAYMTGCIFATIVKIKEIEDKYKAAVCAAENSSDDEMQKDFFIEWGVKEADWNRI